MKEKEEILPPDKFPGFTDGRPGAVVDEELSKISGSYLFYAYYDEEGNLRYYEMFDRDASPEFISETLRFNADGILNDPPEDMNLEDILATVDEIRTLARNVPGL